MRSQREAGRGPRACRGRAECCVAALQVGGSAGQRVGQLLHVQMARRLWCSPFFFCQPTSQVVQPAESLTLLGAMKPSKAVPAAFSGSTSGATCRMRSKSAVAGPSQGSLSAARQLGMRRQADNSRPKQAHRGQGLSLCCMHRQYNFPMISGIRLGSFASLCR